MAGVNKVIILGNLGKDPDVRFLPSGGSVANMTIATSEKWKDKQTGEQKEKTEWHRVVMFGKLAEIAGDYLKKGSKVYIEGQLQTRKWTNNEGHDQYTTEIVVQGFNGTMQMLDSKAQGSGDQQQGSYSQPAQQQKPAQQQGGFANQGQQQSQPAQQQSSYNQGQQNQSNQQQGGFANQGQPAPKVNPQEPTIDFDDNIPF